MPAPVADIVASFAASPCYRRPGRTSLSRFGIWAAKIPCRHRVHYLNMAFWSIHPVLRRSENSDGQVQFCDGFRLVEQRFSVRDPIQMQRPRFQTHAWIGRVGGNLGKAI